MRQMIFLAIVLGLFASQASAQLWNDLRVTFGEAPPPAFFDRMPRLANDAAAQGWQSISTTCTNNGRFSGFRYRLGGDNSIHLLFDVNGIIAGIQALVPHSEALHSNNPYRYDLVPMFQNDTLGGRDYLVLTAYFVNPQIICTTGRTINDLNNQGTGTGLWFQNGQAPNALLNIPNTRAGAAALGWTNCECFPGMGQHNFYEVDRWQETNCDRIQPAQITFNLNGQMTGFVFQISGATSSPRFEDPPNIALIAIIGASRIPQCILDSNTAFGLSTVHIYFVDQPWTLEC